MNSKCELIPIPPKGQWRYFKTRYLPLVVFSALVILAGWIWKSYVVPPTIVGEVLPTRVNIISGVDGVLEEIAVDLLQQVTNGQVVATIRTLDPETVLAELGAIEADLKLMQARMDLDKIRNLDSYTRLHLDLLNEQLALEVAKIKLQQAEAELVRAQKLLEANFISRGMGPNRNDFGYDVAVRDRDALQAEVTARQNHIEELRKALSELQIAGANHLSQIDPAIAQAISAQQERLKKLYRPIPLCAPIDGFVSAINVKPGQRIVRDLPIMTISASKSDKIMAWVRYPYKLRPKPGQKVLVRKLAPGEPSFWATVISVGHQLEPISPTALPYLRVTQQVEFGLPFLAAIPTNVTVVPGEAILIVP